MTSRQVPFFGENYSSSGGGCSGFNRIRDTVDEVCADSTSISSTVSAFEGAHTDEVTCVAGEGTGNFKTTSLVSCDEPEALLRPAAQNSRSLSKYS